MKRIETFLRWINILIILTTFVAYLSPFVNPEKFWLISLVGIAYPGLLLLNILMVAGWLMLKKKYFLFSLACIIMGWDHLNGFIGLHFGPPPEAAQPIRVMTYNTHKFPFMDAGYRKTDPLKAKEQFQFMQSKGMPDILCLQEIDDYHIEPLNDFFAYKDYHKTRYYGSAIFSKFPIIEKGKIEFDIKVNSCIWADIDVNGQIVRVYSLHLQSSNVSRETEKMMAEGQLKDKETLSDIRTIFGKFRNTSKIRAGQAKSIARHIAASPHPVIVCGDFNETPQSFAYRQIAQNLHDTFKKRGRGLGTTYAGNIPALRIDYILCDQSFKVINNHILKGNGYSDHYPVIGTISLN